jgi:hypothetical protein
MLNRLLKGELITSQLRDGNRGRTAPRSRPMAIELKWKRLTRGDRADLSALTDRSDFHPHTLHHDDRVLSAIRRRRRARRLRQAAAAAGWVVASCLLAMLAFGGAAGLR